MNNRLIYSFMIWVAGIILTVLLFLAMLFFTVILLPFDRQRRVAHAQGYWWADAIQALNPYWNVTISGLDNIDHEKTYVVVANHRSLADIVIMYKTRMQFKWVAKESLFKLPIVGWNMALAKHIKLERGNFGSIKKVYRKAAEWLRSGMSVLFFPEGTRSQTSEMKEFQNGAFKLAIKERVPVLPIVIEGTGDAIPKGGRLFTTRIPVSLKVLPSVDTTKFGLADFIALRDKVRSLMQCS